MSATIELTINVVFGHRRWTCLRSVLPTSVIGEVLQWVLDNETIDATVGNCLIVFGGREYTPVATVAQVVGTNLAATIWVHVARDEEQVESVDSMLREFEEDDDLDDIDLDDDDFDDDSDDLSDDEAEEAEEAVPPPALMRAKRRAEAMPAPSGSFAKLAIEPESGTTQSVPAIVTRNITVRYYERMNPERVFPLLVVLSSAEIQRVVQKHVAQKSSGPVQMAADRTIEVEPVLPGCSCYPPKASVLPDAKDQTLQFWVVPEVLGTIPGACVRVSQGGKMLSEIAVEMRVCRQTMAKIAGVATLGLPLFSAVAKHYRIDFESQMQDGFSVYLAALNAIVNHISTPVLFGGLAMLTLGLYLVSRPKKRDLFFDVLPESK